MKVSTWNVNGIRSLKKSVNQILRELEADVTCFQETKISRSQLPENIALIDKYSSYFSYPRKQSGYSGVATYCKDEYGAEDAEEGLSGVLQKKKDDLLLKLFHDLEELPFDLTDIDSEGRVVITYHLIRYNDEVNRLAVINVYCPRVDPEKPERHLYKMQFCHMLEAKTKKLIEDGCLVMIVGDLNITCSLIDHCDPGDENEFNASEARKWLRAFLSSKIGYFNGHIGMIDAFRHFFPDRENAYTCWNTKISARLTNFGTRIDYVLVTSNLLPILLKCDIMPEYDGSDHCPVFAVLKCDSMCEKNARLPSICTRLWPEFSGKQQTLQNFLKKTQNLADSLTKTTEPSKIITKGQIKSIKQKSIKSFFKLPNTNNKKNDLQCNVNSSGQCSNVTNDLIGNELMNSQSSTDSSWSLEDGVITASPKSAQVSEWKCVLKGPPKPPLCLGHSKPSVLRTVKKKGPNYGRQFFMCAQPTGHTSNPDANCNYFKWVTPAKVSVLK